MLWQFFSGRDYFEHRAPCDATQIGRFRRDVGEDGLEQLLKATVDAAVAMRPGTPASDTSLFQQFDQQRRPSRITG